MGRLVGRCEGCGSRLIRWGSYRRRLRQGPERSRIRVARLRCRGCGRTHGELPVGILHRRLDGVDTIGRIIAAGIRGTATREIAATTGVPTRTVRDLLARYRECAPELAQNLLALHVALGHAVSLALDIPTEPGRRAAFALGMAWHAARRPGAHGATPWRWLAAISGGRVLATNTRPPGVGRGGLAVLNHGALPEPDTGASVALGDHRQPVGRAPPPVVGPGVSSAAVHHHRLTPGHAHAILPDHHQIARPPTPLRCVTSGACRRHRWLEGRNPEHLQRRDRVAPFRRRPSAPSPS